MTHGNSRDPHWYSSVPELRLYRGMATVRRKSGQPPPTERWDFITEENAVESIELLGHIVEDLSQWPARLANDRAPEGQ